MQEYIPFFQGEKRSITERLAKYFEYSGLETSIHYDDKEDIYILSIPADKEKEAKRHYQAFYFVERERIEKETKDNDSLGQIDENKFNTGVLLNDPESDNPEEEIALANMDDNGKPYGKSSYEESDHKSSKVQDDSSQGGEAQDYNREDIIQDGNTLDANYQEKSGYDEIPSTVESLVSNSGTYVMKSEQYKDYNGTISTFLLLGVAGIIFVILNVLGVLTFLNGVFPNLIMGALFLYFIYVAISTRIKAKQLKSELDEENKLTDKINQWLNNNITEDYLASISNPDLLDELDYINKTETIRDMLVSEFGHINRDYLESLIEDFYTKNFDSSKVYTESE